MKGMNKRLAYLEQLVSSGQADDFARYALAVEYKKVDRLEDAARAFTELRAHSPNYLPQYLIAGQMFLDANDVERAREWLSAGLEVAQLAGDSKAVSEIEAALGDC